MLVKRLVILTGTTFLLFLLLNVVFPLPGKIEYSTVITDNKGEVIHAFLTPDQKWRMKTELSEISPLLRRTLIAKEDKYFYRHPGVNFIAAGRAAINNLLQGKRTSGASTITMQVARALERRERNFLSKIIETFRAFQLEWKYSKEEILQLYVNLLPYGGNIEGVKAASLLYFKKAPDHLSLAEITTLSIIPNRPSSLVIGKTNDRITEERNRWLHRFASDQVFTAKEITDALSEPLAAQRGTVPRYIPHLAYKLKKSSSSSNIPTFIRLNTQQKIEALTADYIRALKLQNIHNAAVVVVDNKNNSVVSYVGSASFRDTTDDGQVNGAAAVRQPGSTLKPLLYGLCMDEGLLTPKAHITDVPVNYSGYAPENYDRKFNGSVTVEFALDHSLNIPSVKSLQLLGKEKLINKLVACHFKQVEKDRGKLGLSMVLGGCGATLEQLTGLFAAFAHEGVYTPLQLTKSEGRVTSERILSTASSYLITDMLSKVARPDFPLNWAATEHMPKIAWKTGTSYGRRDAWSIGYNRRYTVGVWVGNFSGAGVPELSGSNTATPLLFRIFNTIDYDADEGWYAPPGDCDLRQVCAESGMAPGPQCTNLVTDHFIPLVSTSALCEHMKEWKVSPDSSVSYCGSCAPSAGFIRKWYPRIEPDLQDYLQVQGIPFTRVPPHNPDCEKIFREGGPQITSPRNGSEYYINVNDPEPLLLQARAGNDVSRLHWYIDDEFYKTVRTGERQFFVPKEGPVKISCTDDKGRNRNIVIRVRHVKL